MSVVLESGAKSPLSCLEAGVAVAGQITFNGSRVDDSSSTGIISSNRDVIVGTSVADIRLPVEAVGVIAGSTFRSTTTTGIAARTFPSEYLFSTSYPTATSVSLGSLGGYQSTPAIYGCVLSPATNPFGALTLAASTPSTARVPTSSFEIAESSAL